MKARDVRAEACRLAAEMVCAEDIGQDVAKRLWAYAVFFESYIAHGSSWTKKNVVDAGENTAEILQIVPQSERGRMDT